MIVTFTPNPAVDKTLLVASLRHGSVNRCRESHLDPGGKGINASRVVHRLGRGTTALTVVGGHMGRLLEGALREEGVATEVVCVPEETRLNVILVDEATGASTRVWDRGAAVPATAGDDVDAMVRRWIPRARVLLCAGTLPPGLPRGTYARLLDEAARAGVRTMLDSDGESFLDALEGRPHLVKPNVREAEKVLGRRLVDDADVVRGAVDLLGRGVEAVVISMGAAGSVLATGDRLVRAIPPQIVRRSAVGSGDSLVAGLAIALAEGSPLEDGLRLGTAAGAATAMTVGTQLGERAEIEALLPSVRIEAV